MITDNNYWRLLLTTTDDYWWLLTTDNWWLLMTANDSWWLLMTTDGNWWLLTTDNWWQLMTTDDYWRLLMTTDDFWRPLATINNYWWLLTSTDVYWQPLAATDYYWLIAKLVLTVKPISGPILYTYYIYLSIPESTSVKSTARAVLITSTELSCFNLYLLAFCATHYRETRQYWGRNWKVYQVVFYCTMSVIIGSKLTLHHKINPFRHGWRDIVAGDTKIGAHVLPPHLNTSFQSPPMGKSATLWISKRLLLTTSTIRCCCWAFLDLIFKPPSRFQAIFGWGRTRLDK